MARKRNKYVINENMSANTLRAHIKDLSAENAGMILHVIGRYHSTTKGQNFRAFLSQQIEAFDAWYYRHHHVPQRIDMALWAIDKLLDTHGIEIVCQEGRTSPQRSDGSDILISYANTGHTYVATVIYEHKNDRFVLTSWGDWMETHRNLTKDPNGE